MNMPRKSISCCIGEKVSLGENSKTEFKAFIEKGAEIGNNVKIGPFATILSQSIIKDDCIIGNHCIIGHPSKLQLQNADFSATSPKIADFFNEEPTTRIGEKSIVRSGSIIYAHVKIGKQLRTGHNVLIREHTTTGKNCVVGTHAILDGYLKMGDHTMIQSHCYLTQSVNIGNAVFIAPGCVFMDNRKIILGKGLAGISVEDYARIGGGTKVLPGITIGRHALIGAGSVVTKDIPSGAVAYGVPAEVKRFLSEAEIKEYMDTVTEWQ